MKAVASFAGMLLLLSSLLLVSSACNQGAGTPSAVVREHVRLLNERRFEEFYELHAQGALPPKEVYLEQLEKLYPVGAETTDVVIVREEIDGDRATVTWSSRQTYPGQEEKIVEVTTTLVRENGSWKIGGGTSPVS